jgi:hypothetical protein
MTVIGAGNLAIIAPWHDHNFSSEATILPVCIRRKPAILGHETQCTLIKQVL